MERTTLIQWLATNDKNGVYSDKDSKREGMKPLGKKEAIQIILTQLAEA